MSMDARSKERLEALGRTLPKKLPPPASAISPQSGASTHGATSDGGTGTGRHRLEREENPADLFRALMKASPDGHVPPHLLERLRELESANQPVVPQDVPVSTPGKAQRRRPPRTLPGQAGRERQRQGETVGDPDLYTTFAQLLLEDDDGN